MADLGSIGTAAGLSALTYCALDTVAAWNITNNPIKATELSGAYRPTPKREDWKAIGGTVKDETDAPAARVVRIIERSSGQTLAQVISSAVDGSYLAQVPVTGEVQVVFLDDAAGTLFNDLILRTTPV